MNNLLGPRRLVWTIFLILLFLLSLGGLIAHLISPNLFGITVSLSKGGKEISVPHSAINNNKRESPEAPVRTVEKEKFVIPNYSILNKKIYDTPIKTQVTLKVLVSGKISESGLRGLLNQLYSSTKAMGGFKYHDFPTNIYIYMFTSKERAESALWIAMLAKNYGGKPAISIYTPQIVQLGEKPKEHFGLSEKKRKEIYEKLVLIEDRANKTADKQYPPNTYSFRIGQVLQLSRETPLIPEFEPADPMAALQRMRRLPPGTSIKVLRVTIKGQTPWYFVEAKSPYKTSLGSGWINGLALIGQGDLMKQLKKQAELDNHLKNKYKDKLAKKYRVTREQLEKIRTEGIDKSWPFSNINVTIYRHP